jgi:hypothetical protein
MAPGPGLQWSRSKRLPSHENKNIHGSVMMTIKAHLTELERQHQALENEIAEALAHHSTDDLKIADLKRQKLHLKDEIERLQHDHALWKLRRLSQATISKCGDTSSINVFQREGIAFWFPRWRVWKTCCP